TSEECMPSAAKSEAPIFSHANDEMKSKLLALEKENKELKKKSSQGAEGGTCPSCMSQSIGVGVVETFKLVTQERHIKSLQKKVARLECKSLFPSDEQILIANRGLVVPSGRSVYLTPAHLQLRVNSSDRCVITVLDNDPLAHTPGRLTPLSFPCSFRPQEVQYTHFGAQNSLSDTLRLQLRYDYFHETVIIPFSIHVTVSNTALEVVSRNLPLKVDKPLGLSNPISANTTGFAYTKGAELCKVSLRPLVSGQPKHGEVIGDASLLEMMDCDEFLNYGLRYRHTTQSNSPGKDYLPFVVHILDSEGKITKTEYFHVLVKISGMKENEKPVLEASSKLTLEVDQLLMTALRSEALSARDAETPSDFLVFSFVKPVTPGEGYFVNTDDRNRKVTSFYQRDIRELKIAYVPHSSHGPTLSRTFYVDMQVSDADGAASAPFKLKIVVRPFSSQIPRVVTNRGLQLFEGQSKIIHAESNLQIAGGAALDRAQIYVVDGLRHGRLTMSDNRKYFTVADLRAGSVAYQHDDSDSYSDNTIFKITDGSQSVQFLFPIWIFPEDDEPPMVNVNTGLEIGKSNMAKITSLVLSATDSDSDVTQLRYVLEPPMSEEGAIVKRQVQMPDSPEDWELTGGEVYEQAVEEFTHGDILGGLVFYKHTGPHRSEQITDTVRFHVVDTGDPPNRSGVRELVVNIEPVDDDPPYLFYETSLAMDVVNYQVTEIKKKFLRYTDDDTEDRDIRFNITAPLADTDENAAISAGTIVHCEKPNKGITSFTQGQINQKEICYKPPDKDSGLTARFVQFGFDVADTNGNFLKDQRFSIFLLPVSSPPPLIKNAGISVSEGGAVKLNSNVLDAERPDTGDNDIKFIVLGPPLHGHIKMKSKVLERGSGFSRKNIRDGDIEYTNDSEHIGDDLIVLNVTDGTHHIPVRVRVHVRNTDDERPAMVSGSADVLKQKMQVHESKSSPLPLETLRNSDNDGRSTKLVMERAPYDGLIRRGETQTTEFTLADALTGSVTYQHTGGEVGLTGRGDYFQFTVTNPKKSLVVDGRKIFKISVEVEILPVDNQPPIVSVGSPFEVPESKKAPLLPRHVDATDTDTEDGEILCLVISQPKVGYLENSAPPPGSEKPQTGIPISSFTIGEIRRGAINYVQSVHKGSEHRDDTMTFRCSDGTNHSPEFRFDVRVVPHNDEKPEIALREFTVVEGSNMRIDSQILKVTDGDVPHDKIAFLITTQPRHGRIVRQTREGSFKIQSFTVEDISGESTIAYEHDDSETLTDSFTFDLTDGMHKISKTVPIKILPLDDEPPRLVVNNGLQIAAGESKKITNKVLRAEDPDSKMEISFHVRSKPKYGSLRYIQGSVAVPLTQGSTFTQKDIDKRKIEYVHTDREGLRDIIRLDVSDGLNSLQDRYFHITVEGTESTSPKIFNRGLRLGKNGAVTLTTELLSETDLSASSSDVAFTVTRAPSRGQLEVLSRPGIPISSFTLLQLAENKVRYAHIGVDDHGMDSFEFAEGKGQPSPPRYTFRLLVSDPGNRKPVVMLQTLTVKMGDNKPITSADLRVEDVDTAPSSIVFSVVQTPSRGVLLHNVSRVLSSFTMAEIADGLVSYQHDGSRSAEDRFAFTVTDGAHPDFLVYPDMDATLSPQTVFISIRPDDGGVPQINVNKGASHLTRLAGGHLGFSITNRVLNVEDRDIPEDHLMYTVSAPPKWGYIINRAIGNRTIHTWTQVRDNSSYHNNNPVSSRDQAGCSPLAVTSSRVPDITCSYKRHPLKPSFSPLECRQLRLLRNRIRGFTVKSLSGVPHGRLHGLGAADIGDRIGAQWLTQWDSGDLKRSA
ncbi:Protein M3, partial [Bulinus truncatus]